MRVLCLDVGDRKIGLAISDPGRRIAQGLALHRRVSLTDDLKALGELVARHEVSLIVIGLPRNLDGSLGRRAREIVAFSEEIAAAIPVPVTLWDERFSTNEAHRVLDMANMKQRKRKEYIDVLASQIILQGYLDAQGTA